MFPTCSLPSSREHYANPSASLSPEDKINNPQSDNYALKGFIHSVSSSSESIVMDRNPPVFGNLRTAPLSNDPANEVLLALLSDKEGDVQLTEINMQGRELMNKAERLRLAREQQAALHPPRFRLTGLKACLTGIALVASAAGGIIFFRSRSENPASTDASVPDGPLPNPLALQDSTGTEVNVPFNDEAMQGDQPQADSTLSPYRGYLAEREEGGNALLLQKENEEIIYFLQQMSLLDDAKQPGEFAKEEMLVAVANYLVTDDPEKKRNLARIILQVANLYGGNKNEPLSLSQVESVNRNWLFKNMLGMSPDSYAAYRITNFSEDSPRSVHIMRGLLSLRGLIYAEIINAINISENDYKALKTLWKRAVQIELPQLFLNGGDPIVKDLPVISTKYAFFFTGSRFLADNGIILRETDTQEIINTGKAMWEMALYEGISANMLKYYSTPALFWKIIKQKTDTLITDDDFGFRFDAVNEYLQHGLLEQCLYEDIMRKIETFKLETEQWMSRGKLADTIIKNCSPHEILKFYRSKIPVFEDKLFEYCSEIARTSYLNGIEKPCPTAPDSVTVKYEILTRQLTNSFAEVDEFIILNALCSLEDSELDFIYKENAVIRAGTSHLTWHGRDFNEVNINLNKTDLFCVMLGDEERIYALKGDNGEYKCIRVDRNLKKYLENDLYNINIKGKSYKILDNGDLMVYKSSGTSLTNDFYRQHIYLTKLFSPDKSIIKKQDESSDKLVKFLKDKHEENFYQAIFNAGYDPTGAEIFWNVFKSFIPFYDCVENSKKGNVDEAIAPCMMDTISVIPVAGQASYLGARFGTTLARGVTTGAGILARSALTKSALMTAGRQLAKEIVLPKVSELSSLSLNVLRVADPGVELMALAGKAGLKSSQKIVQYIKETKTGQSANKVIEKLESAISSRKYPSPVKADLIATLPDSDIQVPIKKIGESKGQDIVAIVNPETGEVAGRRFWLVMDNIDPGKTSKITGTHVKKAVNTKARLVINNMFPSPRQMHVMQNVPAININNVPNLQKFLPYMGDEFVRTRLNQFADDVIVDNIYDQYETSEVYIHRLGSDARLIPEKYEFLRKNLQIIESTIYNVEDTAKAAVNKIDLFYKLDHNGNLVSRGTYNPVREYFSQLLETSDSKIIGEAIKRTLYHSKKIANYFETNKRGILLATARYPGRDVEYLMDNPLKCPNGFTTITDEKKQVVLMIDVFDSTERSNNILPITTLHEVSHSAGGSRDFFSSASSNDNGGAYDDTRKLNEILAEGNKELYLETDDIFLDSYAREMNIQPPNYEDFKKLILRDPMLRANVLMDNADSISRIIEDLSMGRSATANGRFKRDISVNVQMISRVISSLIVRTAVVSEKPSAKPMTGDRTRL